MVRILAEPARKRQKENGRQLRNTRKARMGRKATTDGHGWTRIINRLQPGALTRGLLRPFPRPSVVIRVHPWLKRAENPKKSGFQAENRDFGPETARKRRFLGGF